MIKRTYVIVCVLMAGIASVVAQSQDISLTGSGGGMQQTGAHFLSWSLGEPLISYRLQGARWVTEGFQQPGKINVITGVSVLYDDIDVTVFPNPAGDVIHVEWDNATTCRWISIENTLGQQLYFQYITVEKIQSIPLGHWHPGIYLLRIQCENAQLFIQTFTKI